MKDLVKLFMQDVNLFAMKCLFYDRVDLYEEERSTVYHFIDTVISSNS